MSSAESVPPASQQQDLSLDDDDYIDFNSPIWKAIEARDETQIRQLLAAKSPNSLVLSEDEIDSLIEYSDHSLESWPIEIFIQCGGFIDAVQMASYSSVAIRALSGSHEESLRIVQFFTRMSEVIAAREGQQDYARQVALQACPCVGTYLASRFELHPSSTAAQEALQLLTEFAGRYGAPAREEKTSEAKIQTETACR